MRFARSQCASLLCSIAEIVLGLRAEMIRIVSSPSSLSSKYACTTSNTAAYRTDSSRQYDELAPRYQG